MQSKNIIKIIVIAAFILMNQHGISQQKYVLSSGREVPVSARVDILVAGGNEAGVAAAWEAARSGASALVLAENYFLSDDVSAKARYWLEENEIPEGAFAQELFGSRSGGETAFLTPWDYKMKMETMLREAGALYHHNSRPVAALRDADGNIAGVMVASKAGIQAIIAKVVIDATTTGAVARMMGAGTTPWDASKVKVSRIAYQKEVPGSTPRGDFYEYSLEVPMESGSWQERCRAEVLLRDTYNKEKGDDEMKAHAQRMHMIEPVSIITEGRYQGSTWPEPDEISLDVFRPLGLNHLYVVSQSAGFPRSLAGKLTRPVHLANIGQRIGAPAWEEARQRSEPEGIRVYAQEAANSIPDMEVHELLYGHRRWLRDEFGTVHQPPLPVPVWGEYDIIVAGAGPSGMSAALAAGRAGARVMLVEMLGQLGGNLSLGVGGYWRGYRGGINQDRPNFEKLREAGVEIWYNTIGCGALKQGDQVTGITVATRQGRGALLGKVVIDATGDGDICAAAGARFQYINDGDLALQEASYRKMGGYVYLNMLPLDVADVTSYTNYHYFSRKLGDKSWDFLAMAGIRETRLVQGEHVVSVLDQITRRTYSDLISVSLSAYDPHGFHDGDYIYAGLMPLNKREADYREGEGVFSYIPYRSLLPVGLKGIMVVGRCFSATHDAQASVRMNPDMINMGYGGGYAAAKAVMTTVPLRKVNMTPVQDHLVEIGNITEQHRKNARDVPPPTDEGLTAAAGHPEKQENMARLMYGGERSIPPLTASFALEPTLAKAKALCALGSDRAVEYLSAWLDERPLGTGLPYEWDNFIWYNTDPDLKIEGVMWLIGVPRDERAVGSLVRKLNQCDAGGDDFTRIRAVCGGLGSIGSFKAAEALYHFLQRPGIMGHADKVGEEKSIKGERFSKSYIELFLAGALYKCGDYNDLGKQVLESYLDDWRGIFHRYAGYLLYGQED